METPGDSNAQGIELNFLAATSSLLSHIILPSLEKKGPKDIQINAQPNREGPEMDVYLLTVPPNTHPGKPDGRCLSTGIEDTKYFLHPEGESSLNPLYFLITISDSLYHKYSVLQILRIPVTAE